MPAFDEYLLGYKDRSGVLEPEFAAQITPSSNGVFMPMILLDGHVARVWKRKVRMGAVAVELHPVVPLSASQSDAIKVAADKFAHFVGMRLE